MGRVLFLACLIAIMSGCSVGNGFIKPVTMGKAVYFKVDKGSINGHGVQVTGDGLLYHSVPCEDGMCVYHGEHK